MSIVRLKDNHSMTVSLKSVTPRERPAQGGIGMEYLYTLTGGKVMFLPAQAHQEIQALRPLIGEPFTLSKVIGAGNSILWGVERIQIEKSAPGPKPIARAISAAPAVPIPPSLTTPESIRMFSQLVATIQAVKAAEEFSDTIARPVRFAPEDIRAMAISNSIAAQGQNRRFAA